MLTGELQRLRDAAATGDREAILAAIPEPPDFLAKLFTLAPADRDSILAAVFRAFEVDEDRWEIIEAAAMDTINHPERASFLAIMEYIPDNMLEDARRLVEQFESSTVAQEARQALDRRMANQE